MDDANFSFLFCISVFVCYIFQNPESRPVLDVAILAPLPAWKRVQKLMAVISLPDLMFSLAPAAFKKVRANLSENKPEIFMSWS